MTNTFDTSTRTLERPGATEQPPFRGHDAGPSSSAPEGSRSRVATAVIAAAVSAVVTGGIVSWTDEPAATPTPRGEPAVAVNDPGEGVGNDPGGAMTVSEVAADVAPSVAGVEILSGPGGRQVGEGSAVIYRSDGYLVTNNHVVEGAGAVEVTLADGTTHPAEVVGTDPTSDLAVLKVDATGLPAATFADSAPTVGDTAVAIGSPFGLEGSVTSGIVSALDRTLSGGANTMVGMVQTDAPINPGNSGGALVDDRGRVIGINTAILSRSGSSAGIGFAVPATTATSVADQLIEDGQVRWARLGVNGQDVDARVAEAYGLTIDRGALIVRVEPGSAAHDAGLQDGDIVTAVAGEQVSSMVDLAAAIRGYQPGDQVRLTIVRDGQELAIPVTLGTY